MIDKLLEAGMMICWGVSWPVQVIKTYKTKQVKGKSIFFLSLIITGYIFGILYKMFFRFDYVIYLYIINLIFVLADTILYFKYKKNPSDN